MPEDKTDEKWITRGGEHMRVDDDPEKLTREKLPSARGEKAKNTKEALSKEYKKRSNLYKSILKVRDVIIFDKNQKEGVIAGFEGDQVKILFNKRIVYEWSNDVFLKSECLDDNIHWDTMTKSDRLILCKKSRMSEGYTNRNWNSLEPIFRDLLKNVSPAGFDSGSPGTNNPIYNPINTDKTVSQRIKEEIESQHEDEGKEKGSD